MSHDEQKITLHKEEFSGLYAFTFRGLSITGVSLKELTAIHNAFAAVCDGIGCACHEAGYQLGTDRTRESVGQWNKPSRA